MATAFVSDDIFYKHDTGHGHPETPDRYGSVMRALESDTSLSEKLEKVEPFEAKQGHIQAVHSKEHFKLVSTAFENGIPALDNDTVISMRSFDAAMFAAGGVCTGVDRVLKGESDNAFVAVRPPGHHATSENAMGFCLFNNIAVGAKYAQNNYFEVEKVAIIDWDVHHGNGTQGIFYDDPSVFFFSMHQYPWYPGTGTKGETGFGRGLRFTKNSPVKAETDAEENVRIFEAALEDIAREFTPDLIMISAGFDGHLTDPLGQLRLEDENYRSMTRSVMDWADEVCEGRLVSVLEGGYNLQTLGTSVCAHLTELSE